MPASAAQERAILDYLFSGVAPAAAPATIYIALSTGTQSQAVSEPVGGSYARVAVTNNATQWPAATGSSPANKSNANAITFPTATGSWGTIQSAAVYDALTVGNLLFQTNIGTSQTIASGATFSFAAGAFAPTCS